MPRAGYGGDQDIHAAQLLQNLGITGEEPDYTRE